LNRVVVNTLAIDAKNIYLTSQQIIAFNEVFAVLRFGAKKLSFLSKFKSFIRSLVPPCKALLDYIIMTKFMQQKYTLQF
jgi:hypothetical protein